MADLVAEFFMEIGNMKRILSALLLAALITAFLLWAISAGTNTFFDWIIKFSDQQKSLLRIVVGLVPPLLLILALALRRYRHKRNLE